MNLFPIILIPKKYCTSQFEPCHITLQMMSWNIFKKTIGLMIHCDFSPESRRKNLQNTYTSAIILYILNHQRGEPCFGTLVLIILTCNY